MFHALLLIDCWGEKWIKEQNCLKARQFYGRILDFTSLLEFENIIFCSSPKAHHWLEEFYPQHQYVDTMAKFNEIVPVGSRILVGGAAWEACFRGHPQLGITMLRKPYDVYSHPNIVDSSVHSTDIISESFFERDSLPWIKIENFYYLMKRHWTQNYNQEPQSGTNIP